MVIVLGALALVPFVLIMLTSFVKISVVLAILRNALGTQSVPPNQVITGLAFILSMFIMTPVVRNMYHEAGAIANTRDIFSESSIKNLFDAVDKGKEPLRRFLSDRIPGVFALHHYRYGGRQYPARHGHEHVVAERGLTALQASSIRTGEWVVSDRPQSGSQLRLARQDGYRIRYSSP